MREAVPLSRPPAMILPIRSISTAAPTKRPIISGGGDARPEEIPMKPFHSIRRTDDR